MQEKIFSWPYFRPGKGDRVEHGVLVGRMKKSLPQESIQEFAPVRGVASLKAAFQDIREGWRLLPLAWTLGWFDIKLRYRGSVLGPFWLTLSTATMILAMGILYGYLFHSSLKDYLPFISLSIILWNYVASLVNEAPAIFGQGSSALHARKAPLTLSVFRCVIKQILIAIHNIPVIFVVFLLFGSGSVLILGAVSGVVLWIINSFSIVIFLSIIGSRFKDAAPIASSVMQVLFFVTPVIWKPSLVYTGRQYLLLDPFYPMLEVFRASLLGYAVRASLWEVAFAQSAVFLFIAFILFSRMRARVSYWV